MLLVDNDVLEKLAAWDLLADGVRACGAATGDVRILPTAKFRLGLHGRSRRSRLPPVPQQRLREFVDQVGECDGAPSPACDALASVDGIDAGEAILFALAAGQAASLLLTGDKRCIAALAAAAACREFVARLQGRVICLEQVLLWLIDGLGFGAVRQRIVTSDALTLDTAVMAAFGSGVQAEARNVCWALEQRVRGLERVAAGLLVPQKYRYGEEGGGG